MALNEDEKAELVAYLDGELDDEATQAVESKLATSAEARAELDAIKQTWGLLDYLPKASPSPNFTNRTMERLTLEKLGVKPAAKTQPMPAKRRPWLVVAGWAACVAVALGVGYFAMTKFSPAPPPVDAVPDTDLPLVRQLRVLEKWRWYENADDIDFVKKLSHPELFGDDPS